MSSYPVVFDDNTSAMVPPENLHKALADGGKLAQRIHFDDGTQAHVPVDRVHDALKDGGQLIGEDPTAPQQAPMEQQADPTLSDAFARRAAAGAQEAQRQQNMYLGPESQGKNPVTRFAHGLLSYPASAYGIANKIAAGATGMGWKDAAVLGAGALTADPAIPAAYYMTQGTGQLTGLQPGIKPGDTSPENTENALLAGSMVAGGAGAAEAPNAGNALHAVPEALKVSARAASNAAQAGAGIVKGAAKASGIGLTPIEKITKAGGPSVNERGFPEAMETAGPRIAEQNKISPIKTVQDMADGTHDAADRVWKEGYQPQIDRNADAVIDGRPIASKIRAGVTGGMEDLFPDEADKAKSFADKFDGPLTLAKASDYLQTLNAKLKGYYRLSPEARNAMGVTNGNISAMEDAADGLRSSIDDKLEANGESDPRGLRQEYGALKQVQRVFDKRSIVSARQAPLNLQQILSAAGGVSAGLMAGHPLFGGIPFAAATALKYLNSPDMLVRRGVAGLEDTARPLGEVPPPQATAAPAPPSATSPYPMPASTGPVPRNLTLTPGTAMTHVPAAPPIEGEYVPPTQPPAPPIKGALPAGQYNTPQHSPVTGIVPRQLQSSQEYVPTPRGPIPAGPATTPAQTRPIMPWEAGRSKPLQLTEGTSQPVAAPASAPATPEARQAAAGEKVHAAVRAGEIDPAKLEPLYQAAHRPEIEPQHLLGKTIDEAKQVNGEYTPEAKAEAQAKFDDLGIGTKPSLEKPTLRILGGGAVSGKGFRAAQAKIDLPDAVHIDGDKLMEGPDYDALRKSDPYRAAARAHDYGSDLANEAFSRSIENRHSIVWDKVSGNPQATVDLINRAKANGYRVEGDFTGRDVTEATKGMVERFKKTGRWVGPDVLAEGHSGAAATFQRIKGLVDDAKLHTDVTGSDKPTLVYENGIVHNQEAWQAQRKAANHGVEENTVATGRPIPDGGAKPAVGQSGGNLQGEAGGQGQATGDQVTPALHIGKTAPPPGTHVVIAYGGSFNPAHAGHVAAAKYAADVMTKAGYIVDKTVVAPTADSLVRKKLGDAALPLDVRTKIAKVSGFDNADVSDQPAKDAAGKQGAKVRRGDLADSLKDQYPNSKIVLLGGEDAAVPGSKAPLGQPSLYEGTGNHEGYIHLRVPREGDMSSSIIRDSARTGRPISDMTPEAQALFREHVAAKGQPAPAQPKTLGNVTGAEGGATELKTSNGSMPAKYRVVEGGDLTPSHDPFTFAKNPNYPEGVQERAYHSSKEAQARVIEQGDNYDPSYTVTDNPDAVNGPPIITPDGVVLGGNSRAMSTARHYSGPDQGAAYRQAITDKARNFGIDPAEIAKMKQPVLVRQVDAPEGGADGMRRLGSDLNKTKMGALGDTERAVSAGRALSPDSLGHIGDMVNQTGENASLRDMMRDRGKDVMQLLQRDGVITDRERPQFMDTATAGLNEQGKTFAERALRGWVAGSTELLDRAPKSIINKTDGALGDLATVGSRSDEYNVLPLLREGLEAHAGAAEANVPIEDHLNSPPMFGPPRSAAGEVMARALSGSAKSFRTAMRAFATDARADVPGQSTMLMGEKPSAVNAFNHAFHSNLTEAEFHEGLQDSHERASSPGGKLQ